MAILVPNYSNGSQSPRIKHQMEHKHMYQPTNYMTEKEVSRLGAFLFTHGLFLL